MTNTVTFSKEIFRLLSPVLYLSRLFCLVPLKWKKSDANYVVTKSLAYMIYSYAVMIFLAVFSIHGLAQVYKLEPVYNIRLGSSTKRYVTIADVGVVLFPTFFGVIIASAKINRYIDYFDNLNKVDCLLQKQPPWTAKYLFVTITTMLLSTVVIMYDLIMWLIIAGDELSLLRLLGHFLPYYICYYFTIVIELVYWQSVHSIKVRIASLNERLAEVGGGRDIEVLFKKIYRKNINSVIDTLTINNLKQQVQGDSTTVHLVRDLIRAYQKLTEANNSVNDCYGFVILIVVLGCLIHLLVTPYGLYVILLNTGSGLSIVQQAIWMSGHVLRLLLIVEPCHGCLAESKTTLMMVCKLLCSDLNTEVKKYLQLFLVYLTECKIEFTAFDLTRINRGLLTTIAGAVTTYLVILFQFNKDN